jgi:phage tail-like protein
MLPAVAPVVPPFLGAHFVLAIDGLASVNFSKCAGLAAEVAVEEFQEGGENRFAHRLPSRVTSGNLMLTQGAGPVRELWDWFHEYHVSGRVAPRDGQVTLMSTVEGSLSPVRVWSFTRAWPVKVTGPDLDAMSSAIAVESVEIVHHGLQLAQLGGAAWRS